MSDPLIQSSEHKLEKSPRAISKERYLSSEWAEREWHAIWRRCWQAAVPLCDLRNPGDYGVYTVGRESVLVTHTTAGDIKAFYNVCSHRGLRLVHDRCGHGDGFRCPYHSWRYNNAGELTHTPDENSFPQGVPADQLSLKEVRCEQRLGFAWIALDPDAESIDAYLEDVLPLLQHFEFENMVLMLDQTVSVNCNWKAVHDNFSELYHVHHLHPQHRRFVDCTRATNELYPRGHTRVRVPGGTTDSLFSQPDTPTDLLSLQLRALGLSPEDFEGRVEDVQPAMREAKRKLGDAVPYYNNFSDEELTDVYQTNVFPNCIFSYQPEMLWLIRLRPHATDPNRCYLDKLSFERFPEAGEKYFYEGALDTSEAAVDRETLLEQARERVPHDSFDYQDVIEGRKTMTDTIDQDLSLLAHAQEGMLSDGFEELWLNEIECRVTHFHECLDKHMS
jgi:phenylpropionate dioxygenase-like ring-hydroxylating dioxygenase large terminal subunit